MKIFSSLILIINLHAYEAICTVKANGNETKFKFMINVYNGVYTEIYSNGKSSQLKYQGKYKNDYIYSNGWDECSEVFLGKIINNKLSYTSGCEFGWSEGFCIITN